MRFNNLPIPQGATITNAYIQFQTDDTPANFDPSNITIFGEATDNAATFVNADNNISDRTLTGQSVTNWTPPQWTVANERGVNQQTPDLTAIVQEIVNRSGWDVGNSMAFIISGTGEREAESFDGNAAGAPELIIEYSETVVTTNPLLSNRDYEIRLDTTQPAIGGNQPTSANIDSGTTLSDGVDSDGVLNSNEAIIELTTGNAGQNNHTFDFGFTPPSVRIGNRIWFDANDNGNIDGFENNYGIDGVTVELLDSSGTLTATTTTTNGGFYLFTTNLLGDPLQDGDYQIRIPAAGNMGAAGSPLPLDDWRSSTDAVPADTANPNSDIDSDDNGSGTTSGANLTTGTLTAEVGNEPDVLVDGDDTNGNLTVDFGFHDQCGGNDLGGHIFRDFNSNGVQDAAEPGWTDGITVTAYDDDGNAFTTTINPDGSYDFDDIFTTETALRVEFSGLPAWAQSGVDGTDSSTTVQFYNAPTCSADLALQNPSDFCGNNPQIATSCYEMGTYTDGANPNTNPALISFGYDAPATGDGSGIPDKNQPGTGVEDPIPSAALNEIGSVWGLTYQTDEQFIYASTTLKRQSGLGPEGMGGVYIIDYSSGVGTYAGSFDLNGATAANDGSTIQLGSVTRTVVNGDGPADNDLSTNPDERSMDLDAYAKAGRMSFGDIELEEDGDTLWLVNLNQLALISVDVSSVTPTVNGAIPGAVNQYLLSSLAGVPACTNGIFRPYALAFQDGSGYLGGVCSGELGGSTADLSAHVLSFDPNNIAGGFTEIVSTSLGFSREVINATQDTWEPWSDNWGDVFDPDPPFGLIFYPQPMLTDIEFDDDGDMIVGLGDRFTWQQGAFNYTAESGQTNFRSIAGYGDILHYCKLTSSNYLIEGSLGCSTNDPGDPSSPTSRTDDGPLGAGEYFWGDGFVSENPTSFGPIVHDETILGALTVLPGSGEIVATVFDPLSDNNPESGANSQGLKWFNTVTGADDAAYQITEFEPSFSTGPFPFPPSASKGNGLGDLVLICEAAPLEIGNYVWLDVDNDGVQDPSEAGISGVTVQLIDTDGTTVLATAVTDGNGEYVFSNDPNGINTPSHIYNITGLLLNTSGYEIRIDTTQAALSAYELTIDNANSGTSFPEGVDSDATLNGNNAVIPVTTGSAGNNNHTFDTGFSSSPIRIGNRVWYDANDNGVIDGFENDYGIDGVTVELLDSSGTLTATTTTANGGFYLFTTNLLGDPLLDGDYQVRIPAAGNMGAAGSPLPLDDWRSSTDAVPADTANPNSDIDSDDNGSGTVSGTDLTTGTLTAQLGNEPDTPVDGDGTNGNLTVDFGFTDQCGGNDLGGTIFRDFNSNGVQDAAEPGWTDGITVTAYDDDGNAVTTTVNPDGSYDFDDLFATETHIRLEFSGLPSGSQSSLHGTNSGTTVQFYDAPTCGADLGVYTPGDCLTNSLLANYPAAVSCGVITSIPSADQYAFGLMDISNAVPASGRVDQTASTPMFHHPSWHIDQIGNVFGTTIDSTSGEIFAAASTNYSRGMFGGLGVLQYGSIGGGGTDDVTAGGTVYRFDAITGAASVFVQLPQQSTTVNHGDCEASTNRLSRPNTGVGLGNLVYDSHRDQLFVVNWEDGRIYRLDMAGTILDTYDPAETDDGTAGFANGEVPFGVAVSNDGTRLFYGTMNRNIYSIELNGSGGFTGSTTPSGFGYDHYEDATETLHITFPVKSGTNFGGSNSATWVADLQFLPNGDLLAGVRIGCDDQDTFASSYNHDGTTYLLQPDGANNYRAATQLNIGYDSNNETGVVQGSDDYGGVAYYRDANGNINYVSSAGDILIEAGPHGLAVFPDDASGSLLSPLGAIAYYDNAGTAGVDPKGTGGDVEVPNICTVNPLEIGNYVWLDADSDGIQDPSEDPIPNVVVNLYDMDDGGAHVGSTTTDSNGEYYFGGITHQGLFTSTQVISGTTNILIDRSSDDAQEPVGGTTLNINLTDIEVGDPGGSTDTILGLRFNNLPIPQGATITNAYIQFQTDNTPANFDPSNITIFGEATDNAATFVNADNNISNRTLTGQSVTNWTPPQWTVANERGVNQQTPDLTAIVQEIVNRSGWDVGNSMAFIISGTGEREAESFDGNAAGAPALIIEYSGVVVTDNPLLANRNYEIRIDTTQSATADYELTDDNVASGTTLPDGVDSDGIENGNFATIALTTGNAGEYNHTYDFGFRVPPVSIGSFVWDDVNADGVQDAAETGVAGATVALLVDNGSGTFIPATTVTGTAVITQTTLADGLYFFDNLPPGDYRVRVTPPVGYLPSTNQTTADNDNSEDDSNIASQPIAGTYESGTFNLTGNSEPTESGVFDGDDQDDAREAAGNMTVDFGFYQPASIGDTVWFDTNGNGILDGGEAGISGVQVVLYDFANTPILTTTTDASGNYTFTQLLPDIYSLVFTPPAGYLFSPQDQGGDDTVDSDPDTTTGQTITTTLSPGENDLTWDAGLYQPVSIGSYIWQDIDGDGFQDPAESGVAGVTVQLLVDDGTGTFIAATDANGAAVSNQLTAVDGLYFFDNLPPGDYRVRITPLAGLFPSFIQTTANNDDSEGDSNIASEPVAGTYESSTFTLTSDGEPAESETFDGDGQDNANNNDGNMTVDFGLVQPVSIGSFVWEDTNDDGTQGLFEGGLAGATVSLLIDDGTGTFVPAQDVDGVAVPNQVTAGNGLYFFDNLPPGDYRVRVTAPAGFAAASNQNTADNDDTEDDSNIASQPVLGTYESGTFSITTNGEPDEGNLFGSNDGDDQDDGDETNGNMTIDFAFITSASLGDLVWFDTNGDGVKDVAENGISGVEVVLYDVGNTPIFTTTTDANGIYTFTNLIPGDYSVGFTPPADFYFSPQDQGGDDTTDSDADPATGRTATITLISGENDTTWDAGLHQPVSIGSFVWRDDDSDGIQDGGESGLAGATVELLVDDGSGTFIPATTVTGTAVLAQTTLADGLYYFDNIPPNDYRVRVTPPAGVFPSSIQNGADNDDSENDSNIASEPVAGTFESGTFTLINNAEPTEAGTFDGDVQDDARETNGNMTVDFAFAQPASIGDFVWLDENANGIQDVGENGINNVTVDLLDSGGTVISTTTTDATGFYTFTNLTPDVYSVRVTPPAGYDISPQDQGGDDTADSDIDPATGETVQTTLDSGENDLTWDAGLYQPATIGDFVWLDTNADGIQDVGENGIGGITVTLYLSGTGAISTTTTDANGIYTFTNVIPDEYYVGFTPPAGHEFSPQDQGGDDSVDSDADLVTGETAVITIISGETNDSLDAGLYQPASIGDFVWNDLNADGIQDVGENGINNVTVDLLDSGGTVISTTTTDATGFYSFTNLTPDVYSVRVTPPAGYEISPQDQGGDDSVDSDIDPATGETIQTTLDSGENDLTWDAGLYLPATIGDFVWLDTNADGIQDVGENGIGGITVTLYLSGTGAITTTTTDANGIYTFTNLVPADYYVGFELPAGHEFSPQDQGGDDSVDSDADLVTGETAVITITSGETNDSLDAGLYQPASIGDFVWHDENGNGVQDVGENGINNVTVDLLDSGGAVISTTTTNATGFYNFTNLTPDVYSVRVTPPAGYEISPQDQGGDDTDDSDIDPATGETIQTTLDSGENDLTWDAGLYQPATIGDFVWNDLNADGIQDVGENGINNVTVDLLDSGGTVISTTTTDATGFYNFTNLTPDVYSVRVTPPAGYEISPQDQGGDDNVDSDIDPATGETVQTTLVSGENDLTWDAGLYLPASIGDFVWNDLNADGIQDVGENGINNVTVDLLDSGGTVISTTTTDATGFYSFTNLTPDVYSVRVTPPAGYEISPQDQGGDDTVDSDIDPATGETIQTTLDSGENDLTWDAGLYLPATIGDFVWLDTNADGIQDVGENGIGGITVTLYLSGTGAISTTTTDANGIYTFTNVIPGDYYVGFTPPAGHEFSPQDQGGDDSVDSDADLVTGETAVITITSGETNDSLDAGLYQPASIGNFVWHDENGNGVQDVGELGINNVTVDLLDSGDTVVSTTTTNGLGLYTFTNLTPDVYSVRVTPPAGYEISPQDQGGDDTDDSDIDPATGETIQTTLDSGENDLTWDAGLYLPATIGDFVWLDTNADGIQDVGENGIGGVLVTLTLSGTGAISSTTTDAGGIYTFTNLIPGEYSVTFTAPVGYAFSAPDQGGNDTTDSDANPATGQTIFTTLVSGENDDTWDAGLYQAAAIGDFVWNDLNANGIQDGGEPGIGGVTVELLDSGGTVITTTLTDANGIYTFTNLLPDDYAIRVTPPAGYEISPQDQGGDDSVDSDIDPATGETVQTSLATGETDLSWDAGLYQLASLGDFVWLDENANGIQDVGELGIDGITVTLYLSGTGAISTTTTAGGGLYSFDDLTPDTYYVEFDVPATYFPSPQDQGGDDTVDSDMDTTTFQTTPTELVSGENDPTWDAGIYQLTAVSNFVWDDLDADGIQDGGEPGLNGITVTLYLSGTGAISVTNTAGGGFYSFDNLTPGDYYLEFTAPANYATSPQDQGGDDSVDSDINAGGQTDVITLLSGAPDDTVDAGFYQAVGLGNFVWEDLNRNGVQDVGENGIAGVTVTLSLNGGGVVSTTLTNGAGQYQFLDLTPSDYIVTFTPPAGYFVTPQDQGGDDTVDSDADVVTGDTAVITLPSGTYDDSWDAGLYQLASIGDLVWIDDNANGILDGGELGIDGITVTLTLSGTGAISVTTTAGGGLYSFDDLPPDQYYVEFELPAGYFPSPQDQGADDTVDSDADTVTLQTVPTDLESGEDDTTWDLGVYQPASIGNFVWNDLNADGIQDGGELGINGITVTLYLSGTGAISVTTTAGGGFYSFDNLTPGDYYIDFELPAGYEFSPQDQGGDDSVDSDADLVTGETAVISLASGETDNSWDAGAYIPASLGNYVWLDENANGIQDVGELGIDGVGVTLTLSGTGVISSTTTDANGFYTFTNLIPADYFVTFTPPPGYEISPQDQGGDDTVDSDADLVTGETVVTTLISGENDLTWDAGMYIPAALGDFVWLDENANGIQDVGENGINNVTVDLLDNGGTVISTTTTDATGFYNFTDLTPDVYSIRVTPPAGYEISPQDQGGDDTVDSDIDPATGETVQTTLDSGENDLTWDAGLYLPATIGDFVWLDTNADGIQDVGENGIGGITVTLYLSGTGAISTTTTDANGIYTFTNVIPGEYYVGFTPPAGHESSPQDQGGDDAVDSDADLVTGETAVITIISGETNDSLDAGLYQPAALGDFVWNDLNADGIQDVGENGINNVTVDLLDSGGTIISTTTTDATGFYTFTNLTPDVYSVRVTPPAGYEISPQDQGGDDSVDSDIDPATGETVQTTLDSGENDLTWDAGLYLPATIGDFVWNDLNGDSIQDVGENGINNVTVDLLDSGGTVISTTTTDASGFYTFTNLIPDVYSIRVTPPAGYEISLQDQGGDDAVDSDIDPATGETAQITVTSGETNDSLDAALYIPATIGDFVWHDENGNGIQDVGENGINNVTVDLLDSGGTVISTTTTNGLGLYTFTNLTPDVYSVRVTPPAGYEISPQDQGGDDTVDSDIDPATGETIQTTLDSGENDLTWDAGLYQPATIGDFVWDDLNANGVQDVGENGINNVTVDLLDSGGTVISTTTTNASGFYTFTNLIPDVYSVRVTPPAGYEISPQDQGGDDAVDSDIDPATGETVQTTLVSGENDLTWDAGLYQPATIGDFVWDDLNANGVQDVGENGINNVTVDLLDSGGTVISTTTTDATGFYSFTNLTPDVYSVRVTPPAGYDISPQDQGGDDSVDSDIDPATGETIQTTLDSGENDLTWDAGLYQPATIGDFVWLDVDADGVQDGGAEVGLPGITVTLYLSGTGAISTTTTDANGIYTFTNVIPGDYYVGFTPPAGHEFSPQDQGGDDSVDSDADLVTGETTVITIISGETNDSLDAGLYQPATIGDFVWEDLNADGIQDVGENGINNVTVDLLDSGGTVISTTTTDATGFYTFTNLTPDVYSVRVTPPAGYDISPQDQGGDDTVDSDIDPATGETVQTTLDSGENDLTWDAGLYLPATIGDFVWLDTNADGIQDVGENGIGGITVTLYLSGTGAISTTTTDANGIYTFTNVIPGEYYVGFTPPAGHEFSPQDQGGDDSVDSDADLVTGETAVITIISGETNDSLDAGLYQPASIGDFVWHDENGNGVQDVGENGINNVTVDLLDSGGTVISTTTTDATGFYSFTNLTPDVYSVRVTPPAGYDISPQDQGGDDTADSDIDPATGETIQTTLDSGENDLTWDAGLYQPATIGDFVWLDTNADGIQDVGENGIGGITVTLYLSGTGAISTTTTDANGIYTFTNVIPGEYYLGFTPPAGHEFSPQDQGGDDAVDSDADLVTGETAVITIISGETNDSLDASLYQPASIGDFVWHDENGNGVQDVGENGINNVTVDLLDSGGTVISTTTTDATGFYNFTNLTPDVYSVRVTPPAGYEISPQDQGGDDTADSDIDPATGESVQTTLDSGENDLTWDAGLYLPATIGDFVWLDENANGIQDVGENGINNVTVDLLDSGGAVISTTTTDATGFYNFTNLTPDVYSIRVTPPAGYEISPQDQGGDDTADSDIDPATGETVQTTLVSGENDLTWDAGLYQPATIGDFVWLDVDADGVQDGGAEVGLPGITVTLYLSGTGAIATTTTDANGIYTFTNVIPGEYWIEFTPPAGYTISPQDQAGDTVDSDADPISFQTTPTTLTSGEVDDTWDAGMFQTVSLGSFVWIDANNDGQQGLTELGLENAQVELLMDDGFGTFVPAVDATGTAVSAQTTGADGTFFFDNLVPNDYRVRVTPPAGVVPSLNQTTADNDNSESDSNIATEPIAGTYESGTFNLNVGGGIDESDIYNGDNADDGSELNGNMTIDFGFVPTLSLGSFVWEDANGNGTQDVGETGIAGAVVELLVDDGFGSFVPAVDVAGTAVSNQTTLANGQYLFTDLPPGNYRVRVTPPAGFVPTTNQTTANNNDGEADSNIAAEPVVGTYESGTFTLSLYGEPVETDSYDGDDADNGGVDSNGNMTVDFSFFQPVAIGNILWVDDGAGGGTLLDGIRNGTEAGIDGVTVELYYAGDTPEVDAPFLTTVTSGGGEYLFDMIPQGDYIVHIPSSEFIYGEPLGSFVSSPNNGGDDGNDDNADENGIDNADPKLGGISSDIISARATDEPVGEPSQGSYSGTLNDNSVNMTIDFGFFELLTLGNIIWFDTDEDGQIDAGEPLAQGVIVNLLDGNGDPVLNPVTGLPITTTTDVNGRYEFTHLIPGDYIIEVDPVNFQAGGVLEGYWSSEGFVDPDNNTDQDDNGIDDDEPWILGIRTSPITLDYNTEPDNNEDTDDNDNTNLTVDLGFVPVPTAVTLTSFNATHLGGSSVRIDWQTETELDNFGFRLYRSTSNDFSSATEIHFEPSALADGTGAGASYSYTDGEAPLGTVYYWLVDVQTDGATVTHGPVMVQVRQGVTLFLPLISNSEE